MCTVKSVLISFLVPVYCCGCFVLEMWQKARTEKDDKMMRNEALVGGMASLDTSFSKRWWKKAIVNGHFG